MPQGALREIQLLGRLAEQVTRHRLDAVHAGAQEDAVEIQLEDLLLREPCLDQQRDPGLPDLAAVTLAVREEQGPSELLRQRAAPLDGPGRANVPVDGAPERQRIDPRMPEEAMIFDRHEGVLQVHGNIRERYIRAVLVHPEPAGAVGGKEPGIANAAGQPVDGIALPDDPGDGDRRSDYEDCEDDRGDAVAEHTGHRSSRRRARLRRAWSTNDRAA